MKKRSPITLYKQKLITSIINCTDLVELIDKNYVVDGQCCETENLVYKQVFPVEYVPEVQEEAKAYITMKVNYEGRKDDLYKYVVVIIYVIAHQDLMIIENSDSVRTDEMANIIEQLFDGRDDFGFGKMYLDTSVEVTIANGIHRGREMRFRVEDFNVNACQN